MYVDIIAGVILAVILGGAIFYIIKTKRNGAKCIGCPHGKTCGAKKNGCCGCGSQHESTEIE